MSYRNTVCMSRIFELHHPMQVIDQVESTDVDATDADDVDFAGNDGHDVDGVVAERNDE